MAETVPLPLLNELDEKAIAAARPWAGSPLKTWTFRIVSIAIGLAVACAGCEVALRLAGWPAPGLYVNGAGPIELRSPGKNGGAFPPNTQGQLRHYDYSVEWNANSFGFRDREVTAKQNGEWRIGFLGDSFTAGIGVQQAERFSDVFAAGITKSRPHVTVWNLGAPLCGTACEAEMLNGANQSYQLDEVVLAFFAGNDLEDNTAWYHAGPKEKSNPGVMSASKRWLQQHSRLATFLWVNSVRGAATFQPPGVYSRAELDRFWPDTELSLRDLRQAAGSKRLTILYLPSQAEWDDSAWGLMTSRYRVADDARHLVRDAVANWSRKEGVGFMDATEWLRQCNSTSECIFTVDPHWNARGHSLVGQRLLTQLEWTKQQP